MQVANLFFFVGLRVRLVSEISRKLGMCPDRKSARRPRSSREAPLRTRASTSTGTRIVPWPSGQPSMVFEAKMHCRIERDCQDLKRKWGWGSLRAEAGADSIITPA